MGNYVISFAPMEGITGRVFRKIFNKHFGGVDNYYTPFITPKEKRGLDKKDLKELFPENNEGITIIPQILTSSGDAFNFTAEKLMELGYREINLNLGCPSGTVVNKGRGSGALKDIKSLEKLLDVIYSEAECTGLKVSIKTRIGYDKADEFEGILSVYQKFPLHKLIIHPRTRNEFYRGEIHKESFELAINKYAYDLNKISYNGELNTSEDISNLLDEFPKINNLMIGRGLLRYPFLLEDISRNISADRQKRLKNYLDELFLTYFEEFNGSRTAVLKMKELWSYLKESFEYCENYVKEIKKAKGIAEYRAAVNVLFSNCEVKRT